MTGSKPKYLPSEEEIQRQTKLIREEWGFRTEQERIVDSRLRRIHVNLHKIVKSRYLNGN